MIEEKKSPFLKCLGITVAFWLLFVFGPALVMLSNNISAWFSGLGYLDGSFGYNLLVFFSQPMACGIASAVAEGISDEKHNVCVLVNEVIAICITLLSTLCSFLFTGDMWNGISLALSVVVLIACAIHTGVAINTKDE